MTTQTPPKTRQQEIIGLWEQYNGLYVVAGILIGTLMFPFMQMIANNLSELLEGLVPEAVGIIFTVLIIDQLNRRRATNERKLELFDQAKSRSNDMAVDALEKIQRAGWWDEMLEHYLNDARRIDLSHVQWSGGVDLSHKNLSGADLAGANFEGANLGYANLERASLGSANLEGASLGSANLERAGLWNVNLERANLGGANLKRAGLGRVNLKGADLRCANLPDANLSNANLEGAHLRYANLEGASLGSANLSGTNLEGANLSGANLRRANLEKANLCATNLEGAHLLGANLAGANLSGASINDTTKLDETTALPDTKVIGYDRDRKPIYDKYWTPDTDMSRYTDPNHPDFWQPDWAKPDNTD